MGNKSLGSGLHFNRGEPRFQPTGWLITASLLQDRELLLGNSTLDDRHIPRPRQQFPSLFWNERGGALALGQIFPHFSQRLDISQGKLLGAKVISGEHSRSQLVRQLIQW